MKKGEHVQLPPLAKGGKGGGESLRITQVTFTSRKRCRRAELQRHERVLQPRKRDRQTPAPPAASMPRAEVVLVEAQGTSTARLQVSPSVQRWIIRDRFLLRRNQVSRRAGWGQPFSAWWRREYDQNRQQFIESFGIRLVRVLNTDIYENLDGVLEMIGREILQRRQSTKDIMSYDALACRLPPPHPPFARGGWKIHSAQNLLGTSLEPWHNQRRSTPPLTKGGNGG